MLVSHNVMCYTMLHGGVIYNVSVNYMLHHVTPCYTMLHHVARCYIMLHHVAPCCTMLHHVAPCYTMLHHDTPCYTMLHHVAPCCTMLHHVAPCYTMIHHVAPCCTMLHHVTQSYLCTDVTSSRRFMSTRTQAKLRECEMRSRSATNSMICSVSNKPFNTNYKLRGRQTT